MDFCEMVGDDWGIWDRAVVVGKGGRLVGAAVGVGVPRAGLGSISRGGWAWQGRWWSQTVDLGAREAGRFGSGVGSL